jgi:hypothetical protein
MENPKKIILDGNRDEAMRKLGKAQALLRLTKTISNLLGLSYHRLYSANKEVMAESISGFQDRITLVAPPEEKIIEERKPMCRIVLIDLP